MAQLQASLAFRLVALFCLGSSVIMAGIGYTLYHALRVQLEVRDRAEMTGKTEVIDYLLREIGTPGGLTPNLQRLRDIPVGHPHLSVGVQVAGTWLVLPRNEIVSPASDIISDSAGRGSGITIARVGPATWWLRPIRYRWPASTATPVDVVLALDVTDSQRLLEAHAAAATLVAVLGTLLSAVLAWWVARRGLAPIAEVAALAERMTVQRLGAPLSAEDAPTEIRGLARSLNRMLERLNDSFQALEQFSADIAHELRTPLNNLLLQTQVILSRPRAAAEYREALLSNLEELQRLHRMVSDMLFLARADRGMLGLALESVDLAREAADVAEYFEPAASARSQTIGVEGRGSTRGDRLMIRRAITNLLSNAVRYSAPGQVIQVRIECAADAAVVAVTNPCAPIPTEELSQLFGRFTRRNATDEDASGGAGLGLAIVNSIMRLHGGAALAHSDEFGVCVSLRFAAALNLATTRLEASAPAVAGG